MSATKALRAKLIADATVSGLVGTRIYPSEAPEGAPRPYVVYEVEDEDLGAQPNDKLTRMSLETRCVAGSYGEAEELAKALKDALHGFRGTVADVFFGGVFRRSNRDEHTPPERSQGRGTHERHSDWDVWYQDS
ncbi:hypothetical protein Pan216_30370 [Planctomycetes bacterium Pan216]|uniref:DUF3168 domain-containing protein n=1 Tax=Kolteria novifilia TaxID=2527975 RepID=A0A518B5B8_9BACT|nr:hypothetical protein Pan216_30370 [Planctomycetes bacterium Pan216]